MTKEQIDTLVTSLNRLGLGENDGLLMSVISVPLYSTSHSILSSALEQIDDKLQEISNRIKNAGYMESNDGKAVSEIMDEIRAAIANRRVSNKA